LKKHNNSRKKSEPPSKRAKTRGPMRRDTKEVLAELVGKLKEKLDPKKVAATRLEWFSKWGHTLHGCRKSSAVADTKCWWPIRD
jgi:hypothetical protein